MIRKPIAQRVNIDERKLGAQIFEGLLSYQQQYMRTKEQQLQAYENFGKPKREMLSFGSVFQFVSQEKAWNNYLQVDNLNRQWPTIVGPLIGKHSRVEYRYGIIIIHCDNPAVRTQTEYLKSNIAAKIRKEFPNIQCDDIRVVSKQSGSNNRYTKHYRCNKSIF